jgi:hypothetical protein
MERCFETLRGRGAMRTAVHTWARTAIWQKRHATTVRLRETVREFGRARRRVEVLETEVVELRKTLLERMDDAGWRASFEQENAQLRKTIEKANKANRGHEAKYAQLEETYRRLWRATHDPNYVGVAQVEENVVYRVPASRDFVDRAHPGSSRSTSPYARSASPPQRLETPPAGQSTATSGGTPHTAPPGVRAAQCGSFESFSGLSLGRASAIEGSTFASRQMRADTSRPKIQRSRSFERSLRSPPVRFATKTAQAVQGDRRTQFVAVTHGGNGHGGNGHGGNGHGHASSSSSSII